MDLFMNGYAYLNKMRSVLHSNIRQAVWWGVIILDIAFGCNVLCNYLKLCIGGSQWNASYTGSVGQPGCRMYQVQHP